MLRKYNIGLAVLAFLLLGCYANAAVVGTASIRAPAVIVFNNTGSLTNITLTITNGNGNVNITGPAIVGSSTLQSAQTAALYAANYTGHVFSDYNFSYNILDAGSNVSGPSAGAAMTLLAVSAFTGRPIRKDMTMTGTISSNGSIGEIGGVYDKVGAAKNAGIKIVLVPKVSPTDTEDELYLLVQTNFGIPLVQVANISQVTTFAFNPSLNGVANETNYSFYKNYNLSGLQSASLNCTGYCNETLFLDLFNATFNLTKNAINTLNSNPKFANISSQFYRNLNQSRAIANKGYIYTAADLAFLNYVNVFYFNGFSTNRTAALDLLENVQSFCGSLNAPPLTESNYDYVISAQLRQAWGNFTINATVGAYNSSQIDSDEILQELYLGAQANGWCTAATLVYNVSANSNTGYVATSPALKDIAQQRLERAAPYGQSLYFTTAEEAYNASNYPVAILDADYAYALSNASLAYPLSTQRLDNLSISIAHNSTYGVWATEFSKEALFYSGQSALTNNSTLSKSDAEEAYSAALLASQLSTDTQVIYQNLIPSNTPQPTQPVSTTTPLSAAVNQKLIQALAYNQLIIYALMVIIIILLLINIILVVLVMRMTNGKTRRRQSSRASRK